MYVLINSEIVSIKEATELEMMKLWKGLFYTFWMSDKPDVQEELAISLSKMVKEWVVVSFCRYLSSVLILFLFLIFVVFGRH